jgi:hypothetical protein
VSPAPETDSRLPLPTTRLSLAWSVRLPNGARTTPARVASVASPIAMSAAWMVRLPPALSGSGALRSPPVTSTRWPGASMVYVLPETGTTTGAFKVSWPCSDNPPCRPAPLSGRLCRRSSDVEVT